MRRPRAAARTRTKKVMIMRITTMITGTPTTTRIMTMRIMTTITLAVIIQTTSTTMGIANDREADCLELAVTTARR
jgi:hypothetical protein